MRNLFVITVLILMVVTACKAEKPSDTQNQNSEQSTEVQNSEQVALDERVSMYRASIYEQPEQTDSLAVLNKGEQVVLIEELKDPITIKQREEKIAKVRLSDDTEGYIRSRYLALRAVVITKADTPFYARNNKSSGQGGVLPLGTVAFVVDEKANWVKITAGKLPNGTEVWGRWIDDGFSEDPALIADALQIETLSKIVTGETDGDADAAVKMLENIVSKGNAMSYVAQQYLGSASASETTEYEYPDDMPLATVTASNIRLRSEPTTESSELTLIPEGSVVGIIEQQPDEVEIDGTTGNWTMIDYNGTIGWAFGGYLQNVQ
jgi:hypothetical protein